MVVLAQGNHVLKSTTGRTAMKTAAWAIYYSAICATSYGIWSMLLWLSAYASA